jgi:hypothetical protein
MYPIDKAKQYVDEIKQYLRRFDPMQRKSDIDKELYVHDFCLHHFVYNCSYGQEAYSVLGPMLNGAAACEGIAKFVKLTLDYLHMKNILVRGKAKDPSSDTNGPHSWNMVSWDGRWFHLDVTFDMTLKTMCNRYDYFNLSDDEIGKDHFFADNYPKCDTPDNDYYASHGMVISSPKELAAYISTCLQSNECPIVVRLKSVSNTAGIQDKVIEIAGRQLSSIMHQNYSLEVRHNPNRMVFEILYTAI